MDHSDHGMMMSSATSDDAFCKGPGRVMFPGFQFTFSPSDHPHVAESNCVTWLFTDAVLDTAGKYAAAVIGTFFLCISLELLRAQRVHLVNQTGYFTFLKNKSDMAVDLINTLTYIVQVGIAYWIMLLVMLYEAGFFIAIILGLGTGYFFSLRMKRASQANGDMSTKVISTGGDAEEAGCCAVKKGADQSCQCTSPCCENN